MLFRGLELIRNRETREPLVPFNASGKEAEPINQLAAAAMERGLFLFVHWNVVVIAPPLVIAESELEAGLEILDGVLELADKYSG